MKYLLTGFILLIFSGAFSQHQVGHFNTTYQDPSRGNRNIETEVYYPATTAGDNTPMASGQFPVIVFGHGFVMVWSAYQNLWEEIVPKGYIMVFPTTEMGLFSTDHQEFGWDLQFLVTKIQDEGNNENSILFNLVDNNTALMGHSMGGGAALLAADSLCSNGNTNFIAEGKNFGGVELGGNPGDNITSDNCYQHSTSGSGGFAGWFKPTSLDGQLFSRVRTQADGTFDAFNVSITSDGYLQTHIYVNAENDTDFVWTDYDDGPSNHDMNRIFNSSTGMDTLIEVDEWNYISVQYDDDGWQTEVYVYVNNGTTADVSNQMNYYFSISLRFKFMTFTY